MPVPMTCGRPASAALLHLFIIVGLFCKIRSASASVRPASIVSALASASANVSANQGLDSGLGWVEVLSWKPRAFIYHNFLSAEECDHIIRTAKPLMRRSTVVGPSGTSVKDNIRTSYGTFLARQYDPVIEGVEKRLAAWTLLPLLHQEDMQVLRYSDGEKYGAHYDSLQDGSPRVATVLMYLNNDTSLHGGETAFQNAPSWTVDGTMSDCAKGVVAVKPRRGDALLFYSLTPNGEQDMFSMHEGCPVLQGIKWTATKWIHTAPFHPEWLEEALLKPESKQLRLPEDCRDYNSNCRSWSLNGECTRNAGFMVGDDFSLGTCRLSCKACEECAPGDKACQSMNRERGGFLQTAISKEFVGKVLLHTI